MTAGTLACAIGAARQSLKSQFNQDFHAAAASIRQAWQAMPDISDVTDNLLVQETPQGLNIQLIDQDGRRMFPEGSKYPFEATRKAIAAVAPILQKLPNQIAISGHTAAGGTYANPPSALAQTEALLRGEVLSTSPAELMAARLVLEPAIAALVVQHGTPADFAAMQNACDEAEAAASFEQFEVWDAKLHELMATATMLGDVVSDAYVSRMPDYGMQRLIEMVVLACAEGLEAVEDAPDELVAFIEAMEEVPDWIDLDLIEEGARSERVTAALASPYAIRGAFLATFLNEYAALPMAITGSLSDKRAAQRVNETAMFFASTVLPHGMRRDGPGFHAAAMVRLMHSMVRYNVLQKSKKWDQKRFGIPIPQVDQMPAGLIGAFLLSAEVVRSGRTEYNRDERAQIELSRYRARNAASRAPALSMRLCRHCGAKLMEGEREDECSAILNVDIAGMRLRWQAAQILRGLS